MLKPFDIIFYKGETPIARIIKKLTNSQFSHVAIAVDSLHLVQLDWKTPVSLAHINLYNCDELIVQSFRSIGINLIEDDVKMTPDTLSKSKLLYKITD